MISRKKILRRIAAFITALNFLVSVNFAPLSYAADIFENDVTTEYTDKEVVSYQTESVKIEVNGTSIPDIQKIIETLFFNVKTGEQNDDFTEISLPENTELKDNLWEKRLFERGGEVFADLQTQCYRLDRIEKNDECSIIYLTEYYDISNISGKEFNIVPDDMISEDGKYPYGTKMKVTAADGWTADEDVTFELHGVPDAVMMKEDGNYSLSISNGEEDIEVPFHKSNYYLYCTYSEDIRCVINGNETNNLKCSWIDDGVINAEFYVKDDADIKISKVYLVNNITGEKFTVKQSTDGKNASIKNLETKLLSDLYNDGTVYSFEFETVSDFVELEMYCDTTYLGKGVYNTIFENGKCYIDVLPIVYENTISKYILKSYENDNDIKIINSEDLFDNGELYNTIKIPFEFSKYPKLYFNEIKQEKENYYRISENSFSVNVSQNIYSLKKNRIMDILFLDSKNIYSIIYNNIYSNNLLQKRSENDSETFRYNLINSNETNVKVINIKSILYLENNEFHNILTSPLYFYMDDYAPVLNVSPESVWSNKSYTFTIDANDHESFPQISGADAEVNDVYSKINNASSGISEIKVGDYTFENKNGVWSGKAADGTSPDYNVSITEISEGKYTASVTIKKEANLSGFEKDLPVSVKDKCDNKSEEISVPVKIDQSSPEISSVNIPGGVSYSNGKRNFTAVGSEMFDVVITSSDSFSGVSGIQIEYDGKTAVYKADGSSGYRVERNGEECRFVIPVTAEKKDISRMRFIISDAAGNKSTYFYKEGKPADDEVNGTFIVSDTVKPECSMKIKDESVSEFSDSEGHRWYRRTPEFSVHATDKLSENCSGINLISFTVNGKTKVIDCIFEDETDDFSIVSEHDENDPDKFTAYVKSSDGKYLIGTFSLADTDGEVTAEIFTEDNAGNRSEPYRETVYLDISAPVPSEKYIIENENDEMRSFGTFFSRDAKLIANVNEPDGKPSSGLREAVLHLNGEEYSCSFSSEKSSQAVFEIPFVSSKMDSFSGKPYIEVTDNTGNKSGLLPLVSEKGSSSIVFENKAPKITMPDTESAAEYIDENKNKWFSDDLKLEFTVSDTTDDGVYSGIKKTKININSETAVDSDYREKTELTAADKYTVNTSAAKNTDGKFEFKINTEDNAGNPAEKSDTVWIDRTAPEITEVSFGGIGSVSASIAKGVVPLAYGYFIAPGTEFIIKAEDKGASSELKFIRADLYNFDGTLNSSFTIERGELEYSDGIYTGKIKLPEAFKGIVSTYACDNVENKSETKQPSGFIIENNSIHAAETSPELNLPDTSYTDQNGIPLYSSEISTVLTASDTYSGIRSIEWNLSEYGENVWKRIDIDSEGKISGDSVDSFEITGRDLNLVTSLRGNILASADQGNSVIRMRMTDNSGHISETEKYFSIDKNAPGITIEFDGAEPDGDNKNIYKTGRTAFVRVKERSFDGGKINISAGGADISGWTLTEGIAGTDSALYESKVEFSGDGEYKLTVSGSDICGNRSDEYSSETFTIDRTAPQLEVISGGAEKVNDRYYSGSRTLTLRITEKNFDAERIQIAGTIDDSSEGFPEIKSWTSNGDVHTAVLNFEKNAEYTVNISGTDMAGNSLETYSESFCIDNAAPEIRFEGVQDKSANRGDVSLAAFITDTNLKTDTVSVKVSGANRGDISEGAGIFEETEGGLVFRLSELPKEKEYDDIYTVTVFAEDMANNKVQKEIRFSVNRFGSNYVFDESTLKIANTYLKEPKDIILHEINADRLRDGKTSVSIVKDSEIILLEEGKGYTVELSGGEGSWYDYQYVISADNFNDDAAYMVIISSEDEAGNQNNSSNTEKKAELKFGIDKTPPKCVPVNIQNNGSYRTDALEVKFSVSDNILLEDVAVYLNDVDITEDMVIEGSTCKFTVYGSDRAQDVRVTARDTAGNETEETVENILVSENLAKILWHRTWVKVAAGTAATGGIAGLVTVVRRRKI